MTFHATNPATGERLEPAYPSASRADIDRAAERAAAAFPFYARLDGKTRAAFLRRIAAGLEARSEALVARAHLETALPLPRLQSELARTTAQLRLFAEVAEEGSWVDARIDHGDPARQPIPKPDVRSLRRPIGPVAVFGASNFPLAFSVAGGDTASALAAGCVVIVKAHPAHPGTSELAAAAIQEAAKDLPEGVFALLFDAGHEVGVELVRHPVIKAVGFTGSRRAGTALMKIAAEREEPIAVFAEMGSINPVFVLPGALRERAADIAAGLHGSVTLGVGQFCTNPGIVVSEAAPLLPELESRMRATAPAPMLTAAIAEAYRTGVAHFAAIDGVEQRVAVSGGAALFVTDATTFTSNSALHRELFGPATLLVDCRTNDELYALARALEGQLTVTLHATPADLDQHRELLAIVEEKAGRIVFNGYPTGVEVGHAMVHGGPFPATSDSRTTSVGTRAIERFARLVAFQDCPDEHLPDALKERNPLR
ncbi:MAG TPA: aldehyde dehydrogenase (NADP(+)), partial [Polyangiaceae bacterium]|nr:aldehyde dehydrogenase (NADP(+)) [Polyangiaceae bacterium]